MNDSIKSTISHLPTLPGVYRFIGGNGKILYIGKAKNLRSRVRQYFSGHDTRIQLPFLLSEVTDVTVTVTSNELEALFLESNQIKTYLPPYNIKLRDNKNFAFLFLDTTTEIPQFGYARVATKKPGVKYFGPYSNIQKIENVLEQVRILFSYCNHTQVSTRPCFYYHLHRCPGVCVGKISVAEYEQHLRTITTFLTGSYKELLQKLEKEMKAAAAEKLFEKAARVRDQLQSITALEQKQKAILPETVHWDAVTLVYNPKSGLRSGCILKIRDGKLLDKEVFLFKRMPTQSDAALQRSTVLPSQLSTQDLVESTDPAEIQYLLEQYYSNTSQFPERVLILEKPENISLLNTIFAEQLQRTDADSDSQQQRTQKQTFKRMPKIEVVQKGRKKALLQLSLVNAKQELQRALQKLEPTQTDLYHTLQDIQTILSLPTLPLRIECFDMSNTQGTNPVGSMSVFMNGAPAKSAYRKFKINSKSTPDDFAMMYETLSRRLQRLAQGDEKFPRPDLIVIDGGKGQLSAAQTALKQSKFDIPMVGLAKRIEEIFIPGTAEPILLPHSSPSLQLLQRIRDEAHRFGITFHKSLRSKQAVKSALDEITGIGPVTKKILKQKFGTVAEIRAASEADLIAAIGPAKTKILKNAL